MYIISISGASGTGKTTLQDRLISNPSVKRVISNTTRPPRTTDRDGEYQHYCLRKFLLLSDLLWQEKIHGHYYGTRKSDIDSILRSGCTAVAAVTVNCHDILRTLYEHKGTKMIAVHLLSPSGQEVRRRLEARGDGVESINQRIKDCETWDAEASRLDFVHLIEPGDPEQIFNTVVKLHFEFLSR